MWPLIANEIILQPLFSHHIQDKAEHDFIVNSILCWKVIRSCLKYWLKVWFIIPCTLHNSLLQLHHEMPSQSMHSFYNILPADKNCTNLTSLLRWVIDAWRWKKKFFHQVSDSFIPPSLFPRTLHDPTHVIWVHLHNIYLWPYCKISAFKNGSCLQRDVCRLPALRISQRWHYEHLGLDDSLLQGSVLGIAG